ncbi:methyl-accepting chemotaxis protein [Polaromonas naphthalenivorans]|nr:methyl-accepting chemotaxis protein [Polaromonas naphthalenivorans]
MKGLLSFLEKAGLVKTDLPAVQPPPADEGAPVAGLEPASPAPASAPAPATPIAQDDGMPLKLDDIYASEGVMASAYPAERLLRLVDGLSAMDEATRQMAIRAMDAADESWTISDPLADAAAKVKALAAHAERLRLNLRQLAQETEGQLNAARLRQEQVVGNIRKQIAELEALASRELARAAQETAAHEASLKAVTEQTARELEQVTQASQRLQSLALQFGTPATTTTGE